MTELAHRADQEFWQPPPRPLAEVPKESCARCGSEFVVGSRFCHVCGAERGPEPANGVSSYFDFTQLCRGLGLTAGALVALCVGLVCLGAAVATGFVYTATTLPDWQALQAWRMEWLLAAATFFLAGILLKRA
jgi:hypothetical protein